MSDSIKALRDEARERLTAGRGDDDERLAFALARAADWLEQKQADLHFSDCAIYNEPAYPAGPCDCKQ